MPLDEFSFGLSIFNEAIGTNLAFGTGYGITSIGDIVFQTGKGIKSGSTNGNTAILAANDTTFITLTTGATDTLDIGAHSISGNVTVGSGLTMKFDTYGTVIADGYIQFGDDATALGPKLMYSSADAVKIRNAADSAMRDLQVRYLQTYGGIQAQIDGDIWQAKADTGNYVMFKAFDTGASSVEIARLQGAADPYFQIGRDDTGVALNAVTDGLKLQMAGGTGNSSAGQGFGMPFYLGNAASETEERASIDCVLVTATNGAEDARFDFNVQAAGAAPATGLSVTGGGITNYKRVTENHTADDALTLAESGSIHTNYGEDGAMTLTLPASATAGTTFKFVVATAQELRVKVSAAAEVFLVNGGTSTDDGGADLYLVADDEGETATFTCIGTKLWVVDVIGTWTIVQP